MKLRFAVPSKKNVPLCAFHECSEITVVEVDTNRIEKTWTAAVDSKDPEKLARHLEDMGIDIVIAGGIRSDLLDRLNRSRINLVTGAVGTSASELVAAYLDGSLSTVSHSGEHTPVE